MSCYTRHLEEPMSAAGLPFDRDGKREADRRIRTALAMQEADCPDIWRRLKAMEPAEIVALLTVPV